MKIKNVRVYGLEQSIVRSGYPMQISEPSDIDNEVADLKYWLNSPIINDIIKIIEFKPTNSKWATTGWSKYNQNEFKLSEENNCGIVVIRDTYGNPIKEILIDYEDIIELSNYKMSKSHDYITLSKKDNEYNNWSLHRFLLKAEKGEIIDHINRNKDDYRRHNLRKTTCSGNNINRTSSNENNVLGVFYREDRNSYFARITLNKKPLSLGTYKTFEEAVVARLKGEIVYYKEYSPQLHLCKKYGIENPYELLSDIYTPNLAKVYNHLKRIKRLSSVNIGTGHDTALKGIIVTMDLKYPQYFTTQLQRYHWVDIVSSQSKMHSLTKIKDIRANCNKFVLPSILSEVNDLIEYYNIQDKYPFIYPCNILEDDGYGDLAAVCVTVNSKEELFQYIISNLPMGFELWMAISTNYLQLKTIYNQRRTHKLYDWKDFCNWIETLPMSELITSKS